MAEKIAELRYILDHVTMDICDDENIAVIGANGSGKTTFVKLFSGENLPYYEEDGSSRMVLFGKEHWDVFELRHKMGIVSMDLQNRFADTVKVSDVILSGYFGSMDVFRNHRIEPEMVRAVYAAAVKMGMEDKLDRQIANLSLGEMRRVLIARALVSEPGVLILDEPMTGLDIVMKDAFRKMFDILSDAGVRMMMITHELEDIPSAVTRVIMVKDGRVVVDGPKDEVLNSDNLSFIYDADIEVSKDGSVYHMRMRD